MRKFAVLLKFQFKYKLGFQRIKEAFFLMRNHKISSLAAALILCVICVCIFVPYGIVMSAIYDVFAASDNTEGYFSAITIMANAIVFFTSIFSVFGIMFGDKDKQILTPLPIKKKHIFLVNYLTLYTTALISSCLFLFPGFIVFFVKTGFSMSLLFKMLLGTVFFPSMPLAISFVLISLIMRFASNFRLKEAAATFLGALLVCISLLFSNNNELLTALLTKTHTFNKILLNSFFFSKSLTAVGIKSAAFLFFSIVFALLIMLMVYLCGGYIYDSITEKMHSVPKSTKALVKFSQRGQHNAFCVKEIKTILRSPVYALNCVINIVIAPVAAFMISKRIVQIKLDFLGVFEIAMIGVFIAFAIMSMNMVPSTSLSREGKCYWITQIVPVSLKNQAKGRIKAAVILYLIAGEIFIFLFGMLLKIDFLYIIYGLAIIPVGALPFSYSGLLIDLVKPKLYWDKETEAVKQNFNGLLGILAGIFLTVIYMIPFGLYMAGFFTKELTLVVEPIVIFVCLLITRYLLNKRLEKG